ncbi:hypothetical protein Tco_0308267, partial [Tanacetum coccineum]
GAMENFGSITYHEAELLHDDLNSATTNTQRSGYVVPPTSPAYGTQPSGYGSYGPLLTQKPHGTAAAQTGYAQLAYGALPAYSTAGYAKPPYGAHQPLAYGGSFGDGYQPPAYSSDAMIRKDIKVKKSKNKQKPTRNEETSDQVKT